VPRRRAAGPAGPGAAAGARGSGAAERRVCARGSGFRGPPSGGGPTNGGGRLHGARVQAGRPGLGSARACACASACAASHADGARVDHVADGAGHDGEVVVAARGGDEAEGLVGLDVKDWGAEVEGDGARQVEAVSRGTALDGLRAAGRTHYRTATQPAKINPPNRPLGNLWNPAVIMRRYLPSIVLAMDCMSWVMPWISCSPGRRRAAVAGGQRPGGWLRGDCRRLWRRCAPPPLCGCTRTPPKEGPARLDDVEGLQVHDHEVAALWGLGGEG
jgi:hypothetical protein